MAKKEKVVHQEASSEETPRPASRLHHIKRIKKHVFLACHSTFWFVIGFTFAALCLSSILLLVFQSIYQNRVIPGVYIDNMYVGGKTPQEISKLFDEKNRKVGTTMYQLSFKSVPVATVSAATLGIGYDKNLAVLQSMDIGKSPSIWSNIYTIINSYMNGVYLHSGYTLNETVLGSILDPVEKSVHIDPVDAQFSVQNNRVVAFTESKDGTSIDYDSVDQTIRSSIPQIVQKPISLVPVSIPTKILSPNVTTEKANSFGIVQVIGQGTSFFSHSIPSRIHNVALAASRVNGILVAPGEEFSFDKYLGDVSAYTGYQQAYVIQNGHTVLGDGGGVCQVSTTLFRAILNAGLPITERHGHSYRVEYYEEGGYPPGIDATVFYPSVDLKFKNDTGNYILVESTIDLDNLELTYTLYGRSDGRLTTMTTPTVTNIIPAPTPLYQDDPTLPKGTVKQTDFAAAGATTVFNRTVSRGGKVILADSYKTIYAPWQAVYLRGTQ